MSNISACKQAGCKISEDGKCLEGLEENECPHFYFQEIDDIIDGEDEEDETTKESTGRKIFSGDELDLKGVIQITHKYPADLVIILGESESGKTTLLGAIFDIFQIGKFEKFSFAGSLTQKGFELRSFLSRMTSGGSTPNTERTKLHEFRILHLAFRSRLTNQTKHLLLSDISGEAIRAASKSASMMKENFGIVKKAQHLYFIIDGEKLSSFFAGTMFNAESFIKAAIDNNIFSSATTLNIIISKWDIVDASASDLLLSKVRDKLMDRFANKLNSITFKTIAARPTIDAEAFDFGFGVEELLDSIMNAENINRVQDLSEVQINSRRYFETFKSRHHE